MKGVYAGSILTAPQLWRRVKLFDQKPLINGGYDQTTPYKDIRVMIKDEWSTVKSSGGALVRENKKTIWSRDDIPAGSFILHEDTVFRVLTDQGWKFQAGFIIYGIEKVIGDNGMPTYAPAVNLGAGNM